MSRRHPRTSKDTSSRTGAPLRAAVAVACFALLSAAPYSRASDPPPVPSDIAVEAGFQVFRIAHAVGTQDFVCLPAATPSGVAWSSPSRPQATLFDDHDRQTLTHFLSPNPDEGGTLRATWQHSGDTSSVWAMPVEQSDDSDYVEPGAIPWLLLQVVGSEPGPKGGGALARTKYIQRVNTSGGKAPATGCTQIGEAGTRRFVPYSADYLFYRATGRPE